MHVQRLVAGHVVICIIRLALMRIAAYAYPLLMTLAVYTNALMRHLFMLMALADVTQAKPAVRLLTLTLTLNLTLTLTQAKPAARSPLAAPISC